MQLSREARRIPPDMPFDSTRAETLTNEFWVNLLDMGTQRKPTSDAADSFEGCCRTKGYVRWTDSRVDLVFGSNSELRARLRCNALASEIAPCVVSGVYSFMRRESRPALIALRRAWPESVYAGTAAGWRRPAGAPRRTSALCAAATAAPCRSVQTDRQRQADQRRAVVPVLFARETFARSSPSRMRLCTR
jgi:hypothetical protein